MVLMMGSWEWGGVREQEKGFVLVLEGAFMFKCAVLAVVVAFHNGGDDDDDFKGEAEEEVLRGSIFCRDIRE